MVPDHVTATESTAQGCAQYYERTCGERYTAKSEETFDLEDASKGRGPGGGCFMDRTICTVPLTTDASAGVENLRAPAWKRMEESYPRPHELVFKTAVVARSKKISTSQVRYKENKFITAHVLYLAWDSVVCSNHRGPPPDAIIYLQHPDETRFLLHARRSDTMHTVHKNRGPFADPGGFAFSSPKFSEWRAPQFHFYSCTPTVEWRQTTSKMAKELPFVMTDGGGRHHNYPPWGRCTLLQCVRDSDLDPS